LELKHGEIESLLLYVMNMHVGNRNCYDFMHLIDWNSNWGFKVFTRAIKFWVSAQNMICRLGNDNIAFFWLFWARFLSSGC